MKYSDFFMKATKDIDFKNVTTNDIEFAYDIFYKKFGYEPKEVLMKMGSFYLTEKKDTLRK